MTQANKNSSLVKVSGWVPVDGLRGEVIQRYERSSEKAAIASIHRTDIGWSISVRAYESARSPRVKIDGIASIELARAGADTILGALGYNLD